MSFDLRLINGSLTIGADGDLARVVNHDKLVQDVIKMITTEKGSNKFSPQIGSLLSEKLIGKVLVPQNTDSIIQSSVQEALVTLQRLQQQQAQVQAVSPSEIIIALEEVKATREKTDPRQLNVLIKIRSGDGNTVVENITIQLV